MAEALQPKEQSRRDSTSSINVMKPALDENVENAAQKTVAGDYCSKFTLNCFSPQHFFIIGAFEFL